MRAFAHDAANHQRIDLCRCGDCNALALEPQPSQALLNAQYDRYFLRRTEDDPRIKVGYFLWLISRLNLPMDGHRILECGAGEGNLIRALNQRHPTAHITAVEPLWNSVDSIDVRADVSILDFDGFLAEYQGPAFDYVFMLDFLEHLPDPRRALCSLAGRLLNPGAKIIVTTPNADSVGRYVLGPFWPQYKTEHLFYYSRDSIRELANAARLETRVLKTHIKRLPLGYLMSVASSFGPKAMQRLSRAISLVVPATLQQVNVTASFSEWLWVSEWRNAGSRE